MVFPSERVARAVTEHLPETEYLIMILEELTLFDEEDNGTTRSDHSQKQ